MKRVLTILLSFFFITSSQPLFGAAIIYVNPKSTGKNNGFSWTDAFVTIEEALSKSENGYEIWIAKGNYKPIGGSKMSTFLIGSSIKMYGGFAGTETSKDERNLSENVTVLDGDIGKPNYISDNCMHVVVFNSVQNCTLDGFTIINGYALTSEGFPENGGGMWISGTVKLSNCNFISNYARLKGGAIFLEKAGNLTLQNCFFNKNSTSKDSYSSGGAIFSEVSNLTIYNCKFTLNVSTKGGAISLKIATLMVDRTVFSGNSSTNSGGAIYSEDYTTTKIYNSLFTGNVSAIGAIIYNSGSDNYIKYFVNCTFSGNKNTYPNSAILEVHSSFNVANCIFWDNSGGDQIFYTSPLIQKVNSCIIQKGFPAGTNILTNDPKFVSPGSSAKAPFVSDTFNYQLLSYSPAVNFGNNDYIDSSYNLDFLGNKRIKAGTVDLGAFESNYFRYKISVTSNPPKGGKLFGSGLILKDSVIRISVSPLPCHNFINWTEDGKEITRDTGFVIKATGDRNFVANFVKTTFTIKVSTNQPEAGTVLGNGTFTCATDTLQKVKANSNQCYKFVKWTENDTFVSKNSFYFFPQTRNRNFVAHFEKEKYVVTIAASPIFGGTVSGGGIQFCDSSVTIKADTLEGYKFWNWTENNTGVSTLPEYSFKVTKNRNLVANFREIVGIPSRGLNKITRIYPNPSNEIVQLEIQSVQSNHFEISVFNTMGQLIKKEILSNEKGKLDFRLDVSKYPKGFYNIRLLDDSGITNYKILVK